MGFSDKALLLALLNGALAFGLIVGLIGLRRARTGDFTLRMVDLVIVTVLGAFLALVQVRLLPISGFGMLHVLYLDVVVATPIVAASVLLVGVLVRRRLTLTRPVVAASAGALLLAPIGFYGTHVEPFRLRVDRVEMEFGEGPPIRIGVIADIQTGAIGEHEHESVDRLLAEEPDVILVAGDFFQSDERTFNAALPEIRALFDRLEAPAGVFLVRGDADSEFRTDLITEGLDLTVLEQEVDLIDVGGRPVAIGGVSVDGMGEAGAIEAELAGTGPPETLRILLTHRPDPVLDLRPDSPIDLVVAGHTHGGQVALPIIGPPVILTDVPREVAAGGLHDVDGHAIYVSTGVGMERHHAPQVRFGVRPSVGVIEVTG